MGSIDVAPANTLEKLAGSIPAQICAVTKLIERNGLPMPVFDEAGAIDISAVREEPQDLLHARNELINLAHDLLLLARGPIDHLVTLGYHAVDTANLGIVMRFQLPQRIPLGSSVSLVELSTTTGLPQDELARALRYATTKGLFTEPSPGVFAHSAISATLAKNKNIADMSLFNSTFSTRIVTGLSDALYKKEGLKLPDAPATAFNEVYAGYNILFDYMEKSKQQTREYFSYLDGRSQLPKYTAQRMCDHHDWHAIENGTIIDCGGSSGHSAMAMARHLPNAKFVVQDINAEGLRMGQEIADKDPQLKGRITWLEHDLFKPQDVVADAYFFRHILHDWSDENCIKMIKALVPALKDGARILISEGVMPKQSIGRTVLLEDMQIFWEDSVMLAAHNARERSLDEYTNLFKAADAGFSFVGKSGGAAGVAGMFYSLLEYKFSKPS